MLLGNKIRSLGDEQGILQRQVAAYLEIDTPMFSKNERGDRRAKSSDTSGTDCSDSMVPITPLCVVPIQRYRHIASS